MSSNCCKRAAKSGWQAGRPGLVDLADADQISQVDSVLEPVRRELHPDERVERHDAIALGLLRFGEVRGGDQIIGPHFLAGIQQMHGRCGSSLGAVEEHVDAERAAINESCRLQRRLRRFQVAAANQNIHVPRVADRILIDAAHPLGDGIAANDGVGHTGPL